MWSGCYRYLFSNSRDTTAHLLSVKLKSQVDEAMTQRKKELIIIMMESFLHFQNADSLDAAWLTEKICSGLQSYSLE